MALDPAHQRAYPCFLFLQDPSIASSLKFNLRTCHFKPPYDLRTLLNRLQDKPLVLY